MVRCFSQDGAGFRDYDFPALSMAPQLREELLEAFVKRTAPGGPLTALESFTGAFKVIRQLDHYLASLLWPPRRIADLTPDHFDGFYKFRRHRTRSAGEELGGLTLLLRLADGVTDDLAARMVAQLPARMRSDQGKESYSRAEFERIAAAARTVLRAAARRIRENREWLELARRGAVAADGDQAMGRRLQLLESVDRCGDVPRRQRRSGATTGLRSPADWILQMGTVREVVSWLHLTYDEVAAGAVLLAVMTGENPEVILKVPSAHHRADGYTGQTGTAIVDLLKPRRLRRAHMTLALSDVPSWIGVPDRPAEVSTRDELHTPFGLYLLLHELTARSRALAGGNCLLVGYAASGGYGAGAGLRPLANNGAVRSLGKAWGLTRDAANEEGNRVPLVIRLDLLRLTYIELYQKPVAHTEQTAATAYLARNRGNVTEYRKVVAAALAEEVDKARTRGRVATLSQQQVAQAAADPDRAAVELGLTPETLKRLIAGELDTVMAGCADHLNGPHAPPGKPCPASFMLCLGCECARALPRHLPVQVLVHDRLEERRDQIDALGWARRFAAPHAQLADLLGQHDETSVSDARRDATEADHALVDRFLNREFDVR